MANASSAAAQEQKLNEEQTGKTGVASVYEHRIAMEASGRLFLFFYFFHFFGWNSDYNPPLERGWC
jgi:hypothetical protein